MSLLGRRSASASKDLRELVRRDDFELGVRAVGRALVGAPPAEVRGVTKTAALHVVVSHLDHQLRSQRLPAEVFSLAPATLRARHALAVRSRLLARPVLPGMPLQRSSPASAASFSGEFATTTSGCFSRGFLGARGFVGAPFARDGATRGPSPSVFRKCGGHGASPSPSASCRADNSSKASSEPACRSMAV